MLNAIKAVKSGQLDASAIAKATLKYKLYTFSFAGGGSAGPGAGASATVSLTITSGAVMLGFYLTLYSCTSAASYGFSPNFIISTTTITVSANPKMGTAADVCQGVIVAIEP